jgi:hypothetical protein
MAFNFESKVSSPDSSVATASYVPSGGRGLGGSSGGVVWRGGGFMPSVRRICQGSRGDCRRGTGGGIGYEFFGRFTAVLTLRDPGGFGCGCGPIGGGGIGRGGCGNSTPDPKVSGSSMFEDSRSGGVGGGDGGGSGPGGVLDIVEVINERMYDIQA